MENLPKSKPTRGRPRKIPGSPVAGLSDLPALPKEAREMFGLAQLTDRTKANGYYADIAKRNMETVAELLRTERPDDPVKHAKRRIGLDWILSRKTVLTELGRMLDDASGNAENQRILDVVFAVADRHDKLTVKTVVARIRSARLRRSTERKQRIAALHHDLNEVVNLHRQRYPESTWKDVQQAVDMTKGIIDGKNS